jgi:putative membrane protein
MKLLVRWVVSGLALFAAAYLVPGIHVEGQNAWIVYAAMAAILGLVNAVVRPILKFLSCPLILLTLGVFILVINAVSFWLASSIAQNCVVSIFFNLFIKEEDRRIEKIE